MKLAGVPAKLAARHVVNADTMIQGIDFRMHRGNICAIPRPSVNTVYEDVKELAPEPRNQSFGLPGLFIYRVSRPAVANLFRQNVDVVRSA